MNAPKINQIDTKIPPTQDDSIKDLLGANSEITTKLAELYRGIEQQPLPENVLNLLAQLDEVQKQEENNCIEREESKTIKLQPLT